MISERETQKRRAAVLEKKNGPVRRLQYLYESGRRRKKYRTDRKSGRESRCRGDAAGGPASQHRNPASHRHTFAELADSTRATGWGRSSNTATRCPKDSVGPVKRTLKTLRSHFGGNRSADQPRDIETFKEPGWRPRFRRVGQRRTVDFDPGTERGKKTKVKVRVATDRNISSVNREIADAEDDVSNSPSRSAGWKVTRSADAGRSYRSPPKRNAGAFSPARRKIGFCGPAPAAGST